MLPKINKNKIITAYKRVGKLLRQPNEYISSLNPTFLLLYDLLACLRQWKTLTSTYIV